MKKVQRKSKDGEKGSDKEKDEKIKLESPGSDYIIDGNFGQPLNPNLPFSPEGTLFLLHLQHIGSIIHIGFLDYQNSGDSNMSSDLSLDGSNFDQLDDASDTMSLQNLDLHPNHLGLEGNQYLTQNNNNNLSCIDKLYQMQSQWLGASLVEQ